MARYKFDQIAFNSTDKKKPTDEDKEHYIGLEHLDSGSLQVTRWGSEIAPKGEKLLMKKGDVLFGKRRAYQKKVAIAPFDGIFSAHGMVLRPKTEVIDPDFFPLFIASDYFLDAAIKISVGSLSPTINWRNLKELEFDIPSLSVQTKLAKVLWAINDTKGAYQKLTQETDELVKSQFIEMFGDPLSDEYSDAFTNLESIFEKPQAGEWGKDDINGDGIPVLRTTNFTDEGYLTYDDVVTRDIDRDKVTHKFLQPGDILIEKSGGSGEKPVGRVVLFEGDADHYLSNNFTARLHLNGKYKINRLYVFFFMFVNYRRGGTKLYEGKTTGIHNLRLDEYLKNTSIPIPPMEVQSAFEDLVKQSDKSKFELNEAIKDLDAMYKRIIKDNLG